MMKSVHTTMSRMNEMVTYTAFHLSAFIVDKRKNKYWIMDCARIRSLNRGKILLQIDLHARYRITHSSHVRVKDYKIKSICIFW